MSELIQVRQDGDLLEITLNRPDKRNAINAAMFEQFDAAVVAAGRTSGLRALVIRGAGKVFSAGIDVTSLLQLPSVYGPEWQQRMRTISADFQAVLTRLARLELPTIALLHGYCLGLAFELALACDFRIAAGGTMVGLPESRLGIIPDVGGTTRLTRLAGPGRARDLILTGRQIEATTAEKWGLLTQVVGEDGLDSAAAALVAELRQAAPLAIGMAKRVIDGLADEDRGLQMEAWAQSELIQTEDFLEGAEAFMSRRPPEFKGK